MKKKLALFLSIIFLFGMALPLHSFGAGVESGLESAIKKAKTLFTIPEAFKFDHSINSESGKTIYYLSWRSKGSDGASISARIDDKGTVLSYDTYKSSDYILTQKLPKVSRLEAKSKADAFIKKVNASIVNQIKYEENYQNNILDMTYYFSYYRIVNGIPFYNDRVSVTINKNSGDVQSYYTSWTEGLVFPVLGKEISMKQAEEAYKTKLGLRLQYMYSYNDDKMNIFLVYTPRFNNETYAVDAFTGEKTKVGNGYYGVMYDMALSSQKTAVARASGTAEVVLNPEESKAVLEAAKLKTSEQAEKIARDTKFLEISSDFKLSNYNLYPSYPIKEDYLWNLSFTKTAADDKSQEEYINVSISANTGMIMSFYKSYPSDGTAKPKFVLKDTKAEVDAFVKENYPDLYKSLEYDADYEDVVLGNVSEDMPRNYSYKYNRMVNGIVFPDNGISITYDAVTGKMTNLNLNWYNVEFPSAAKVIAMDTAYAKLFAGIGLELQYKTEMNEKILPDPTKKPDVKLVYTLKQGKPLFLDANSGDIIDSTGNPYKEVKPVSYTDIANSPVKKKIMVLAENGVSLDGTLFKPKVEITQLDFLTLLSKTISYYSNPITARSTKKDIDDMYAFLEREGIVKSGEKAPAATVTREDAVKFIIRALKYDKVAEISSIFKSGLKDINKAKANLKGYITIAEGLKIITGAKGYFYPRTKLTREDAAAMIYNYLQV